MIDFHILYQPKKKEEEVLVSEKKRQPIYLIKNMIMETLINDHIEERINIPCCQVYNCFSKKQSKKKNNRTRTNRYAGE